MGYEQDGLSSLGYDLLLEFPDRDKFVVDDADQALKCMYNENLSIIFADDIFGTTHFDVKRFEDWRRKMTNIQRLIKCNNSILLLSLHIELVEEAKVKPFYDFYEADILNISSTDLQLNRTEMKNVLTRSISVQEETLRIEICRSHSKTTTSIEAGAACARNCIISEETIDKISKIANPSGFPGEVALFTRNIDNINRGEIFFTLPSQRLFREIERLRNADQSGCKDDMNKYLALIAVFVYGKLDVEKLKAHDRYLQKKIKKVDAYVALCFGTRKRLIANNDFPEMSAVLIGVAKRFKCLPILAESIMLGLQNLLGRYLVEYKRGRIKFSSISVERAVAISCAQDYPEEVIRLSSPNVFEHIIGPDSVFGDKRLHIPVQISGKLCRTFIKRLCALDAAKIIQHPAMRSETVAGIFIQHLQKEYQAFVNFVKASSDVEDSSVLTLSLHFPYRSLGATSSSCLSEDIILTKHWQTIRNRYPSFVIEKEKEILEHCCKMGWERTYLRLICKLQNSLTKRCLIFAIDSYSEEIIKDIIQNRHHKILMKDWYEALEHACNKLDEDDPKMLGIILLIKDKKVKFEIRSLSTEAIIHSAAQSGNDLLLAKVIALCDDKDWTNMNGETCLHVATAGNHQSCVRLAIENGVSHTLANNVGELPIHYACKLGYLEITDLLINHDANLINQPSKSGKTPLHFAAEHGHVPVIRLLLEKRANANLLQNTQKLPAHYALKRDFEEALACLIDAMLFVFPNPAINTLFDTAVERRNYKAISLILGQIVNKKDRLDLFQFSLAKTLDKRASVPSNIAIVSFLLENGADLDTLFSSGLKEFHCAKNILYFIIKKGYKVAFEKDLLRTRRYRNGQTIYRVKRQSD